MKKYILFSLFLVVMGQQMWGAEQISNGEQRPNNDWSTGKWASLSRTAMEREKMNNEKDRLNKLAVIQERNMNDNKEQIRKKEEENEGIDKKLKGLEAQDKDLEEEILLTEQRLAEEERNPQLNELSTSKDLSIQQDLPKTKKSKKVTWDDLHEVSSSSSSSSSSSPLSSSDDHSNYEVLEQASNGARNESSVQPNQQGWFNQFSNVLNNYKSHAAAAMVGGAVTNLMTRNFNAPWLVKAIAVLAGAGLSAGWWEWYQQYKNKKDEHVNTMDDLGNGKKAEELVAVTDTEKVIQENKNLLDEEMEKIRQNKDLVDKMFFVNGETALHLAAYLGDVDVVKELMDKNADPLLKTDQDHGGFTPLHLVFMNVKSSDTAQRIADLLMFNMSPKDKKIYINMVNVSRNTALHRVVERMAVDTLNIALKKSEYDEKTFAEYEKMIKWLLGQGADQSIQNQKGKNPLHIMQDGAKALEFIKKWNIGKLADIGELADIYENVLNSFENALPKQQQTHQQSPQGQQQQYWQHNVPQQQPQPQPNQFHNQSENPVLPRNTMPENQHGNTALYNAVRDGDGEKIKWLLDDGAQVWEKNVSQQTPLQALFIFAKAYQGKNVRMEDVAHQGKNVCMEDVAQWLLDQVVPAQRLLYLNQQDANGKTALHYAVQNIIDEVEGRQSDISNFSAIRWLVKHGADKSIKDYGNKSFPAYTPDEYILDAIERQMKLNSSDLDKNKIAILKGVSDLLK